MAWKRPHIKYRTCPYCGRICATPVGMKSHAKKCYRDRVAKDNAIHESKETSGK